MSVTFCRGGAKISKIWTFIVCFGRIPARSSCQDVLISWKMHEELDMASLSGSLSHSLFIVLIYLLYADNSMFASIFQMNRLSSHRDIYVEH